MNHKQGDIVLPGEKLCTCEEYISLKWTYIDNEGYIRSSIGGKVLINEDERTINIEADDLPEKLMVGALIVGYITEVKPHKILVTIKKIVGKKRELITGYKGYVHISKVTNDYVPSMYDLFHIGDIIEARVTNVIGTEYIELTTAEENLGIIKAMCVDCRKFMQLDENTGHLVCKCGKKIHVNYQKIMEDYKK